MRVEWQRLEAFYHVAKAGSFTLASKRLNISQPCISRTIQILEHQFGVQLFYRVPKGVKLTPEGEIVLATISRTYDDLHGLFLSVQDEEKRERRDYSKYLGDLREIIELDHQTELKAKGEEAARVLLDSALADTVLHLEQIRDEIMETQND
jgi:hypothetical protein